MKDLGLGHAIFALASAAPSLIRRPDIVGPFLASAAGLLVSGTLLYSRIDTRIDMLNGNMASLTASVSLLAERTQQLSNDQLVTRSDFLNRAREVDKMEAAVKREIEIINMRLNSVKGSP